MKPKTIESDNDKILINEYFELMNVPTEKRDESFAEELNQITWFNVNEPIKEFSLLSEIEFNTSTSLFNH